MFSGITDFIIYGIAFSVIAIGSYTDLRTREIPDWINFGLIGTGFGLNILFSAIFWKWNFLINSILGFGLIFLISITMYYTGQWGGGDSKVLMGLGSLIGINFFGNQVPFMINFLVNTMFLGAIYGLAWSAFLAMRNKKKIFKEIKKTSGNVKIREFKRVLLLLILLSILFFFLSDARFDKVPLFVSFAGVIVFYIWIFVRAVERCCMMSYVNPKVLTEGDWIAEDIFLRKRKKESFLTFLKREKKLGDDAVLERLAREIFVYSENVLLRFIKSAEYYFRRRSYFSFYKKLVCDLLNAKTRKGAEKILRYSKLKNIEKKYFKLIRKKYNFDYEHEYLAGPKDLGVEKKQINKLIGLYNNKVIGKVLLKQGIPFVPSFLLAFIITLAWDNLIFFIF